MMWQNYHNASNASCLSIHQYKICMEWPDLYIAHCSEYKIIKQTRDDEIEGITSSINAFNVKTDILLCMSSDHIHEKTFSYIS